MHDDHRQVIMEREEEEAERDLWLLSKYSHHQE